MEKSYQMTVETGDIILMPNGIIGVVASWDIIIGGNCKRVSARPFTNWLRRLFLFLSGKDLFYDRDINRLKLVAIGGLK